MSETTAEKQTNAIRLSLLENRAFQPKDFDPNPEFNILPPL
jgi:hypothetical protein